MPYLTTQQRNSLERAVVAARKAAELGAQNALISLSVDQRNPYPSLTPEQMNLREQLRNKARLLGDVLDDDSHTIDRLVNELSYEYWHKMLFARFLEANHLLMHPDGVPVSMEDCEELASEMGMEDKWDVASSFASQMLPAIFRPNDPVLQVRFATNDRIKLESILDEVDSAIFTADDSLGWVYQFWQSDAKAIINASGDKIDGEKLPAVTQLFTEPYMVHFLIDNTIGAWWVSRNKGLTPPVKFEYLRLLDGGIPAAGSYPGWPDKSASLTVIDPCMGSGHIVVAVFLVLVRLRMHEEGLSAETATDRVIAENIHGLEIDPRCTQLAAFNLALAAWKFCGGYRELPEMNLACSGVAPKGIKEEWQKLVEKVSPSDTRARLENGMAVLYEHFQLAPELGSLLDASTIIPDAFTASIQELQPIMARALDHENDQGLMERGVVASGIAKAGVLLSRQYTLHITNFPYLVKGKQDDILSDYCSEHFERSKKDLSTVFLERVLKATAVGGTASCVIPQNWLFLTTYAKLRIHLLQQISFNAIAILGSGAFRQITGEVVKAILLVVSKSAPPNDHHIVGIDVSDVKDADDKAMSLLGYEINKIKQSELLKNPDARILFQEQSSGIVLATYSNAWQGIASSDKPRFTQSFWEQYPICSGWKYQQGTVEKTKFFGGKSMILFWEDGHGTMTEVCQDGATFRGKEAWGKKGIAISQMTSLPCTLYYGELFDNNTSVLLPYDEAYLPALWEFCSSSAYLDEIRKIDKKLNVTNTTLVKVHFEYEYYRKIAEEKYPKGLPEPFSSDPTQWLFHGHPAHSDHPLQLSIARIMGYRFPAENDTKMELSEDGLQLAAKIKQYDHLSDSDGIVCIPSVNGEHPASDRVREYARVIYEKAWDHTSISRLLQLEGSKKSSLEQWLRDEFFEGHCKLFENRPFVWHIWDGRKDGFSVLVNYHKFDKENLQKLIYGYLGDWIRQCLSKVKAGESGAEGLVVAAITLQDTLKLILEGEPPYDIFVRWKPLHEQPIGWEPDLNDGVRINVRPFIEAGILRKMVKIKYGIDRGKNPPGSPWGEIRDNDRHLTLAEKRLAREKRKKK